MQEFVCVRGNPNRVPENLRERCAGASDYANLCRGSPARFEKIWGEGSENVDGTNVAQSSHKI